MTESKTGKGWVTPALFLLTFVIAWLTGAPAGAQVQPAYLYSLSDFTGPLRYDGVRLNVDLDRGEAFLIYQNVVRIFNPSGMETYRFGDGLELGQIVDVAADGNGDIIVLSYKDSQSLVTRCNFRGEPLSRIDITGLPGGVPFNANRMIRRGDQFYFIALNTGTVVVTGANGDVRRHVDLLPLLDGDEKQKSGADMFGFTVDGDGNIYFSVPTMFRVFKLAPDGTMASFGRPGSAAGRFGVVSGLAIDSRGNLLVADKLRSVVMIFDKDFKFLAEFGYRGTRPENLVVPDDLAIDGKDRLYVSQARRRGVSVFALNSIQ